MKMLHLVYLIQVLSIFLSCTTDKKNQLLLEKKTKQIETFKDYVFFVTYFPDSIQRSFWKNSNLKYHPYRYLRDTASIQDLLKLVQSDNAFVKLYSFSALEKRGYKDLYSIVWKNLSDTTSFYVQSDDHGWYSTTADMMIYYAFDKFSKEEKDSLKHKILLDYINLHTADGILMFHKPNADYYDNIKQRATEREDVFSLIGLAAYQKTETLK